MVAVTKTQDRKKIHRNRAADLVCSFLHLSVWAVPYSRPKTDEVQCLSPCSPMDDVHSDYLSIKQRFCLPCVVCFASQDLKDLDEDSLRFRVAQLATELQERTKWEALRLMDGVQKKEAEIAHKVRACPAACFFCCLPAGCLYLAWICSEASSRWCVDRLCSEPQGVYVGAGFLVRRLAGRTHLTSYLLRLAAHPRPARSASFVSTLVSSYLNM